MIYTQTAAVFSPCKLYRYTLERWWSGLYGARDYCQFCMLNPSTADADKDDATVNRAAMFAKSWGYAGLVVTNIFAYRATDPRKLYHAAVWYRDCPVCGPIGPENDEAILRVAKGASRVICAWGCHGALMNRWGAVTEMLVEAGVELHCLGVTKEGFPKHPLYIAGDTKPSLYKKSPL